MDRYSSYTNAIGNTNRRYRNLNYNPTTSNAKPSTYSTTYSINFSVPASQNIVKRPYLPGLKKKTSQHKGSYNTNLNKYKLLEKELNKREQEQQQLISDQKNQSAAHHSQSYSNIFSNQSPQFKNRDTNCQLAKPNVTRSTTTINNPCETTNSLNDLYKAEKLFGNVLDNRNVYQKSEDCRSKSTDIIKSPLVECTKNYATGEQLTTADHLLDSIDKRRFENQIEKVKLEANSHTSPPVKVCRRKNQSPDRSKIDHHHSKERHHKESQKVDQLKAYQKTDQQLDDKFQKVSESSPPVRSIVTEPIVSTPKILLTEPSIEKGAIEFNSNRTDVGVVERERKEVEKSACWFSWFKVLLDFGSDHPNPNEMILIRLKKWYRELILITILLVCILNAIRTSNLATRKTKLPEDFFPSNTLIQDYKFGHIHELSHLAFQNEVTFVMYYAPWNAECIAFRNEYLKISKHFKDQIFFAAVNCWWPDGDCSKSYRIKKYPVFIAHIRNIGEVEYKGPLVASYLIPFLDNLLNPVKPIQNEGDLLDLKSKHDGVVVGYFDFNESSNPTGYNHFLLTSIKALFQDPFRKVQFAIVSSRKAAYKLYIEQAQSITLYTWNSTYYFKGKLRKVDNLLKWIYDTLEEDGVLVEWITPIALKSDTLSVKLLSEPTLILFTPRSLILNISPYYETLREVAMDYYNCDNSPQIKSLIHRIILRRRLKEEKLFELEEKCHEMELNREIAQSKLNVEEYKKLNLPRDFSRDDACCHSQLINWRPQGKQFDKRCFCTACVNIYKNLCPSGCKKFNCLATASRYLANFEPNLFNNSMDYCNEIKSSYHPKYTPYYDIKMVCSGVSNNDDEYSGYRVKLKPSENEENLNTFKRQSSEDHQPYVDESMQRMMKNFEEQHCRRLNLGLNYNDFNFPDSSDSASGSQKWRQNFTGLGCRTNKTLGFIAIDSLVYQSFTESLGINAFNETHATVVMIAEAQEENIYVLNHRLSKKENQITTINKRMIYEFVKDYDSSKLRRYLRSPLENRISSSDTCLNTTDEAGRRIVCVPEITTNTFNEIVLDDTKDVILLFYTNWCGFCSTIASTFLNVAKFFNGIEGILFARLNADFNDLPFEYNVDRYPSLILFPAKRKSESVTFPSNMPITATSLLQWTLANAHENVRWMSSFQLCNEQCLKRNLLAHHLESQELNLEKLRIVNRMANLRNELKSLLNSAKNKNLKKVLNDYLIDIGKVMRSKESRYNLFNNLKEILNRRILNFDQELTQDLNNQLINDMINLLNAPLQQQTTKKSKATSTKATRSKKSKSSTRSSVGNKDEL